MDLKGKTCIVTGGARGIGFEIVKKFADAGANKIYACDVNVDGMGDAGAATEAVVLDVTDVEAVKAFVAGVLAKGETIDVLVNNAGITRDALIHKMDDEAWSRVIDINLKGVFNITREVGPAMMEAGSGSIVNMASVVGIDGNVGQTNYAATKAGVIAMAKSWAKEFSRKGAKVRANSVAPGFIRTPMTETVPEHILDALVGKTPLGRMGEADDIADCVLFLASDASRFITGQTIRVDGGLIL